MDTRNFTDEQREEFISGWEDAGGYMDDLESPTPWCCPWEYCPVIDVESEHPYNMGIEYWGQVQAEVENELSN